MTPLVSSKSRDFFDYHIQFSTEYGQTMQDFIPELLPLPILTQAWETENTRKKGEINESLKAFKQFGFGLTEETVKASKCGFY